MSDTYKHGLAQRDDFVVRFQCEANWERFADERSDPELARVIRSAVIAELARRAQDADEPAPAPTPTPTPAQPEEATNVDFTDTPAAEPNNEGPSNS